MTLLQREERLQQIVKLVGPDVLPDSQRLILFIAEMLKDGFLPQSAFDEKDMYCAPERQVALLRHHPDALPPRPRPDRRPACRWRACASCRACRRSSAPSPPFGNDELHELAELEKRVSEELDALASECLKQG